MKLIKSLAAILLILIIQPFSFSYQPEKILSYDSKITVNKDASMIVTETITVHSEGLQIKRGIYRDFPTQYKDKYGNDYNVKFEILKILRDGRKDDYHTQSQSNGVRIYIGNKNRYLTPGDYTYTIKYKTSRQIGFFDKFDELYWNVTGNGWGFHIDKATATVILPEGISSSDLKYIAYTGKQGSRSAGYIARVINNHTVWFETTSGLRPREGLTIVVEWPKGFVTEPTTEQKLKYFIEDNLSLLILLIGIVMLFGYYFIVWLKVGVDPQKGVIIPLYEPPFNLSPAATRFINKMKFDKKAFSCAVVNLCVKGFAQLKEDGKDYSLIKMDDKAKSKLSKDELKLVGKLRFAKDNGREIFEIKQKNHTTISAAVKAVKKSLKNSFEKVYFFTNKKYFIVGIVLSLLILSAVITTGKGEFAFIMLWNSFWAIGVIALVYTLFNRWRTALAGKSKGAAIASALFITIFAIPFVIGQFVGLYFLSQMGSFLIVLGLVIVVIINVVFHHLLKAPTKLGREVMDKIEGFKLYLSVAEKDRLNSIKEPEKTPELFEKFLPYAIALDVENEWGEKFADVLKAIGDEYKPAWYSGTGWSTLGAVGLASSVGSSLATTIASSSVAPGSSSGGGGGGFSGGGGGGGGGGGW